MLIKMVFGGKNDYLCLFVIKFDTSICHSLPDLLNTCHLSNCLFSVSRDVRVKNYEQIQVRFRFFYLSYIFVHNRINSIILAEENQKKNIYMTGDLL